MIRAVFFSWMAALLLAGCVTTTAPEPVIGTADGMVSPFPAEQVIPNTQMASAATIGGMAPAVPMAPATDVTRVAILVPLSGPNAQMGEALLQAAQLAVFDLNEKNFQLIPKDTHGTPEGARVAVDEAAREGAKLILGPLFAQEVESAKAAARGYGLTVLAFSTDWRQAGDNVYSMGVLPFGQTERIADYAARQGLRRIGVLAPRDMYGDATLNVFQSVAQRYKLTIVKTIRFSSDGSDAMQAVQQLTNNQAMTADRMPYDALFIPAGGSVIRVITAGLKSYGLTSSAVHYLGTGLWDDPNVIADPNMAGALYAAPSPQLRAAFETSYQRIYGVKPPRLASIGYDAAALAVVLSRNATAQSMRASFDRAALTDPNGFSGVDGIFRFGQNGLADRGMAILQIGGGSAHVVEAAPSSFTAMNH